MGRVILLVALAIVLVAGSLHAQVTVYDTVTPNPSAGYGEVNTNNPIFGDGLALSQGGELQQLGLDLYNSTTSGNTGTILTGTMIIRIYDDTNPYAGGSLSAQDPLIANFTLPLDFTGGGGLPAGSFSRITSSDLTGFNITVPQNIFITQQFTELTGTSTANGTVLSGSNSAEGSSPANVYIDSAASPEGLYTFSAGNLNQFAYSIAISVPEPASLALCAASLAILCTLRGRNFCRRACHVIASV